MFMTIIIGSIIVTIALGQAIKESPIRVLCSDPSDRVYTRKDNETQVSCIWKSETEFTFDPTSTVDVNGPPPNCAWHRNREKLFDTLAWSGTIKVSTTVDDTVTVHCITPTCSLPTCIHKKTTITLYKQDVKFFFSPPSPIQQYELVYFGWCAKMKSSAWKYEFSSRQGEAATVIPSNYHTEIEDSAYPAGLRDYCSTYYNYKVHVRYSKVGKYVASLTLQNNMMPELVVSIEVERALLYVLRATSPLLPPNTEVKLSWMFEQLTNKVSAFQLTDENRIGNWDVAFTKYAINTVFCSSPFSTSGHGFAVAHFLTNGSKIGKVNGDFLYTKGAVALTVNLKSSFSVKLNPSIKKSNTYYFSQTSGLHFSSENKEDMNGSDHFIFLQQESFVYLFQLKFVDTEKFSLTVAVYLNRKSLLYKSLNDTGLEVHLFSSGSSLLYTSIYIVWFIPFQHPSLQCEWTFILELYGSKKNYLFRNTTYTYTDKVSNAASFIPGIVLPFNPRYYAGFVAKVNFTRSGVKPVVLKAVYGRHDRKVLETSVYCYKVFCQIDEFHIERPAHPAIIVSTRGARLSIFVAIQVNCSAMHGVNILWRIYSVSSESDTPVWDNYLQLPQVLAVNQNNIEIPEFSLNYGFYVFNVSIDIATADDDEESSRANTDSVVVEVRESDLIAVISGGSYRTVGFSEKWTLDGHSSYDPDSLDPFEGLTFSWYCSKTASDYQTMTLSTGESCQSEQISLLWVNPSAVSQSVEPETLQGNRHYHFRLSVSKANRTAYIDQTVFIAPGSPPAVSVKCIENCRRILVPTERFSLSGKCTDCSKTSRPQYEWSIRQSSTELSFDWKAKTTTGRSIAYMSFMASAFIDIADMWYSLDLTVTTWTGAPSAYKYTFYVNSPPKAGSCNIEPSIGIALQTKFIVSCKGFSDKNLPLRYKVLTALDKVSYISSLQQNSLGVIIYDGYNSSTSPLLLPIGAPDNSYILTVYVQVSDALSSYTQIALSVTVVNSYEDQPEESSIEELISHAHDPTMRFFLDTGDFLKTGHFIYMIASVLNSFKTDTFVQALMDKRSELRESLLNMSSSIMITNIMAVNQIITSISQLTKEAKEVNTKSQHIALTKLREVSVALTKYRKGIIGSVESEKLSSGILESLSNVLNASLIKMDRFAAEIPLPSVDVLKNTLSVLETVTDAVSFGKVPGESETSMVTNNFRITLKREEKWDLSGSHRKTENTFPSFFLKLHDNESTVPVDAIVTYAFYEFLEDPLPWLKNGRDIDTVITGFYMVAPDDTGRLMNLHPTQVDVIMKRKNIPPVFDIWVSPDVHKTTSGIFCFEVDQTSEAEWFVQFFYAESIIFDISLHIGDNITNNPVAFFRIPNSEEQAKTSEDENIKTWNSKMIRIPLESFPEISLIHNITIELTTTFVVWRKTKLLRASIFNIACLDFEDMGNNWNEGNCKVGNFSNNTVIHCICEGLTKAQRRNVPFLKKRHTFLSARVFVLPNPIDLTKVTVRSLQSNLVTLLSVLVICVTYLGLSMWARKKDISDQTNRDAIRLPANSPDHEHRYSVTIYTGSGFGSGTTAKVYLEIMGTERNHRVLCLTFPGRQLFRRGGIDTFIFTTSYPLGDISKIRIWHDNTGNSPGWFLSRVKIEKMFSDQEWFFVCQAWLDAERHYGLIHRSFSPMNTQQPLEKSEYFYIILSCRLKEEHLCFSVFLTNLPLALTRFQRLSCSFVILMCSLLINIIFFNAEKSEIDEPEIQVIRSFMVGLQSSTVMFFIEWLVDKLIPFSALTKTSLVSDTANQDSSGDGTTENSSENIGMESRVTPMECLPTRQRMSHNNCVLPEDIANQIDVLEDSDTCTEEHPETQQENVMLKTCYNVCNHLKVASCFLVAWGSKYVVWGLLFSMTIISAVLIILYGLSYGFNLSMMWLTASVTCFFQNGFLQIAKTVFFSLISCIRPKYCKDIPWPCRHMSKNSVLEIQRCYS